MSDDTCNTLVVCTAGQERSPTATQILEEKFDISARFGGTHPQARRPITQELIDWSDYIIAMDERSDGHKTYLKEKFDLGDRPVFVFDIPDTYPKGDPELVSILKDKLQVFVDHITNKEDSGNSK